MGFLKRYCMSFVCVILTFLLVISLGMPCKQSSRLDARFPQMEAALKSEAVRLSSMDDPVDGIVVMAHTLQYTYGWFVPEGEFEVGAELKLFEGQAQAIIGLLSSETTAEMSQILLQEADNIISIGNRSRFPMSWLLASISAKEVREVQIQQGDIEPDLDFPVITAEGLLLPAITVDGFPGLVALPVKRVAGESA